MKYLCYYYFFLHFLFFCLSFAGLLWSSINKPLITRKTKIRRHWVIWYCLPLSLCIPVRLLLTGLLLAWMVCQTSCSTSYCFILIACSPSFTCLFLHLPFEQADGTDSSETMGHLTWQLKILHCHKWLLNWAAGSTRSRGSRQTNKCREMKRRRRHVVCAIHSA